MTQEMSDSPCRKQRSSQKVAIEAVAYRSEFDGLSNNQSCTSFTVILSIYISSCDQYICVYVCNTMSVCPLAYLKTDHQILWACCLPAMAMAKTSDDDNARCWILRFCGWRLFHIIGHARHILSDLPVNSNLYTLHVVITVSYTHLTLPTILRV